MIFSQSFPYPPRYILQSLHHPTPPPVYLLLLNSDVLFLLVQHFSVYYPKWHNSNPRGQKVKIILCGRRKSRDREACSYINNFLILTTGGGGEHLISKRKDWSQDLDPSLCRAPLLVPHPNSFTLSGKETQVGFIQSSILTLNCISRPDTRPPS